MITAEDFGGFLIFLRMYRCMLHTEQTHVVDRLDCVENLRGRLVAIFLEKCPGTDFGMKNSGLT